MKTFLEVVLILIAALFSAFIIFLVNPYVMVICLKTLFNPALVFNFQSWISALFLLLMFKTSKGSNEKNN